MATTVYAARTQELRRRIERMNKDTPFQIIYGNFDEFCGLRRLSRIQITFARKRLVELRDMFPDEAAQNLFEKLEIRIQRAQTKQQAREDARVAAKLAGQARGCGRRKQETPVAPAAPPASPIELWKRMLKDQQEKKS
jgi:hypothetical protein